MEKKKNEKRNEQNRKPASEEANGCREELVVTHVSFVLTRAICSSLELFNVEGCTLDLEPLLTLVIGPGTRDWASMSSPLSRYSSASQKTSKLVAVKLKASFTARSASSIFPCRR